MADLAGGTRASSTNGGAARTAGPVPVTGATAAIRTPRDVMRDRNAREAARKQQEEEQKKAAAAAAEERRKSAERRAAATLPGAGTGVPRASNTSSQYSNLDASNMLSGGFDGAAGERRSRGPGEVAGTQALGDPTGRSSLDDANLGTGRRRASLSQDAPRAAIMSGGGGSRRSASQSVPRQPATANTAATTGGTSASAYAPPSSGLGGGGARGSSSTFPHAFERWETLSSHWEGLTSYWLHRLEQNTEEIKTAVPTAATLSRQITDLSAAGANLFHAVVELQRLRASSERKFQRWFFDVREEMQKEQERTAEVARALKAERSSREETLRQSSEASAAVDRAKKEVAEMRRELVIAKDEARRAWEELGRRNQDSLDTAQSLRDGRVTIVSGVQVVPYFGGPASRTASSVAHAANAAVGRGGGSVVSDHRPPTRDGLPLQQQQQQQYNVDQARVRSPDDRLDRAYYREATSPTNTDPFTDSGRQMNLPPPQQQQQDPAGKSFLAATYQPHQSGTPASAQTTVPVGSEGGSPQFAAQQQQQQQRAGYGSSSAPNTTAATVTAADAARFYQQTGTNAYLHEPSQPSTRQQQQSRQRQENRSDESYVTTNPSEEDRMDIDDEDDMEDVPEYVLDGHGNVQRDENGHPIIFTTRQQRRRGAQRRRRRAAAEEGGGGGGGVAEDPASTSRRNPLDDYDDDDELDRRQPGHELADRYASQMIIPEAPSVPATSAQAMATYPSTSAAAAAARAGAVSHPDHPDYEGEGYGEFGAGGEEGAILASGVHHYPTRLSDVLEEEEERSSRRTGGD